MLNFFSDVLVQRKKIAEYYDKMQIKIRLEVVSPRFVLTQIWIKLMLTTYGLKEPLIVPQTVFLMYLTLRSAR